MSFISHHHRRFQDGYEASSDFAALLAVVEGPPEPEDYSCEWCGHAHARPYRGATLLCVGCIAEIVAMSADPIAPPAPTGTCTECGGACHGELCDPCAADLEPATEDCLGCGVLTDVNDLDDEGLCRACVGEAEDAAREAIPA